MPAAKVLICGIDEAGRGPLAGPVYAAAVILNPARGIRGLADSKVLTPERREVLANRIKDRAIAWSVAWASVEEIDRLNIFHASMLAMRRTVEGLKVAPEEACLNLQRLAAEVGQKKKLVAALRRAEASGLRALPFLRDLTELVPQDAWLQSLNMDSQGVEIIGQAGAASQLIPTLESSPWLERVEFTSPVTKGQGKEQFRLRASWERH